MSRADVLMIGNSLTALTAAVRLSEKGIPCTIVNPTPHWGGYFNGQELYGQHFDLGMVLYEFTSFNAQADADVLSFDTTVRNDCGRFTPHIEEFVHDFVPTCTVDPPEMIFRGKVYKDIEQTNHLEVLREGLTEGEQQSIQEELRSSLAQKNSPLHARFKLSSHYDVLDYETAAFYNHGPTLHKTLVSPIARKITGASEKDLLARWHRVGWVPLFYPETLLSQWSDAPQALEPTVFSFPTEGDAGALPRALMRRLRADPGVTILEEQITGFRSNGTGFELGLGSGTTLESEQVAWSAQHLALLRAAHVDDSAPQLERTSLGLALLAVPPELIGHRSHTLFIVDEDTPIYRTFNQDICVEDDSSPHRLSVEVNTEFAGWDMGDAETVKKTILEDLQKKGVITAPVPHDRISLVHLEKALTLPTKKNEELFAEQLEALRERFPALSLISPAGGFFISSMNNQVVAGLQFAKQTELSCGGTFQSSAIGAQAP